MNGDDSIKNATREEYKQETKISILLVMLKVQESMFCV